MERLRRALFFGLGLGLWFSLRAGPLTAQEEKEGPNLLAHGSFEEGEKAPAGWETPLDNLSLFWEKSGRELSRCLRMDTDVYLAEWEKAQKELKELGAPSRSKKTPTSGDKYDTVGGTKGVSFYSRALPVKKGAAYRLSAWMRGKATDFFFPKVFVKGYAEVRGEKRVLYTTYLACRVTDPDKWEHFEMTIHPTDKTPLVTEIKVMLYAYWPPGDYYFDDVRLVEVTEKK